MIFSRDAVQAKLQSLTNSSSERNQTLTMISLINLTFGLALFVSSLFTSRSWGSGIAFQATSTASAELILNFLIFQWLKHPDPQKLDILGGAYIMLILVLFQTSLMWSTLSSGFSTQSMCFVNGSSGDRATSLFAALLLVSNCGLAALAYMWREDFSENRNRYTNLAGTTNQIKSHIAAEARSVAAAAKNAFKDEEVDGGL